MAKRLTRDMPNAMVLGVCSGLAKYFGIDVALVRLVVVLSLIFTGGTTALIYLLAAVVIPEE